MEEGVVCSVSDTDTKNKSPNTHDDSSQCNPYAYLDRTGFTSEKFKIEIRGLPKYYGIGELKKLLNEKLKLGSNKLKPPKNRSNWLYVCFRSEEDRQNAIKALNGYVWKNKILSAQVAQAAPDPLVKRRKLQDDMVSNGEVSCESQPADKRPVEERLKESTTPYWNIPYEEQILKKQDSVKNMLRKLSKQIMEANSSLAPWIKKQRVEYDGLPCELWDTRKSPVCNGYRNKCEFTIGLNEDTGQRTVGFRLCSYVRGFTGVGPVDNLLHIPDKMKSAAKILEKFICMSEHEVYKPETQDGVWRQLTVRVSSSTGELMLIIGIHPQNLSQEELNKLKDDIKMFFTVSEGKDCNVTSLYLQFIKKKEPGKDLPPPELLLGETHIYETVLGLKFRISPLAFFQVNTAAAEVLYSTVKELAVLNEDKTLIDVCCGTGTIGLCLSKYCGQVLGLESLAEAVQDAKTNAQLNNVTNCEFFVGKAEEIVLPVLNRSTKSEVLAIVDPPRAGLHQKAILQLRKANKLNKLVFLSCDPKAALKNFIDLARPASKTLHGSPFIPVKAVAVDLFPHTPHCELVMYFERVGTQVDKSQENNN